MSKQNVLVLVEHKDGAVDSIAFPLLIRGRRIADRLGTGLDAIVLGSQLNDVVKTIAGNRVDNIYALDSAELSLYNPELWTHALSDCVLDMSPILFLLGYTFLGMEIGPAVAMRSGIPLLSNCIDIDISDDDERPFVVRSVFNGATSVKMKGNFPVMVSIQKGSLPAGTSLPLHSNICSLEMKPQKNPLRTVIKEVLRPALSGVDLTKAEIIVAVGRGIGQPANIKLAIKLADVLGGVVAGTRPVIDMGWLPQEYLVGLSGRTVSPRVYIACGISGAAQHIAGMIESQRIIALNKDAHAPIMGVAHYAVVGDLFEILPELIDAAITMN